MYDHIFKLNLKANLLNINKFTEINLIVFIITRKLPAKKFFWAKMKW